MRKGRLLILFLAAALSAAPLLRAGESDLPEGIEAYADRRDACFLPGERQEIDARIDAQIELDRQPLPGCATGAIPPAAEVMVTQTYKPGSNDVVDCASIRNREAGARYLNLFLDEVIAASEGANGGPACAAGMIRAWAEADAMRVIGPGGAPTTSRILRMFTFSGLSAAYLIHPELRRAAGEAGDGTILAWFGRLAARVEEDIARMRARPMENNILYWQGFALLPTALMTADPGLLAESRRIFDGAVGQATADRPDPEDDGFLPLELQRGDKALSYQAYALRPILGLATLSQAYGCDFLRTEDQRGRLASLMTRTLEGYFDPTIFGAAQVRLGLRETAAKQQRGSVEGAPGLLYLVDRLDPRLYDGIDADLAAAAGKARPVFAADRGAGSGNGRMGGAYARLADTAHALAAEPAPAALAGLCDG